MICKGISSYIGTILLKCKLSRINQTLYFVLKCYILLDRVPRDATMVGACGVRIVPLGKWRLIDPSWAHYDIGIRVNSIGFLGVSIGVGICTRSGLCREWILWVMLGRSLWLIGRSWSEGRWARGGIQYWPSNYIGVRNTDTWGCEGFVGSLAMWVLRSRHGYLPHFSLLHLLQASYF